MIDREEIIKLVSKFQEVEFKNFIFDWALELGPIPTELEKIVNLVSMHDSIDEEENISWEQSLILLNKYESLGKMVKFCPIVNNLQNLILGFQWQQQNSKFRNFLPRSNILNQENDFVWFRLIIFQNQKINFVKNFLEQKDQPTWFEYYSLKNCTQNNNFGAVIGTPIKHSFTPIYQMHLNKYRKPFLKINVEENNFLEYLNIFEKLKIHNLAITSPLKLIAQNFLNEVTSINTFKLIQNKWIGKNTDEVGFHKLIALEILKKFSENEIAVWGGGGVLDIIQKSLPNAQYYSIKSRKLRFQNKSNKSNEVANIKVVIWCAPSQLEWSEVVPPDNWIPQLIIDLNYLPSSLGLRYYLLLKNKNQNNSDDYKSEVDENKVSYINGIAMFTEQAKLQNEFWKE